MQLRPLPPLPTAALTEDIEPGGRRRGARRLTFVPTRPSPRPTEPAPEPEPA